MLGTMAGMNNTGERNVFLGFGAGTDETGSNKLYIENSSGDETEALMWGDFENDLLRFNAGVGIGVNPSTDYGIYVYKPAATATTTSRAGYYRAFGGSTSGNAYGILSYSYAYGSSTSYAIYADADGGSTSGNEYAFYGLGKGYFSQNVGIGNTPSSTYRLYVIGNTYTSGTYYSSDKRYKKDIQILNNDLEKIKSLNGVSYKWKQDEYPDMKFEDTEQIGLIAQEVEEIYPQLVIEDENGYKAVDYSRFAPILIEAIKEQQRIIEKMGAEIEMLKSKVGISTGTTVTKDEEKF
jgi:hypothetical protein